MALRWPRKSMPRRAITSRTSSGAPDRPPHPVRPRTPRPDPVTLGLPGEEGGGHRGTADVGGTDEEDVNGVILRWCASTPGGLACRDGDRPTGHGPSSAAAGSVTEPDPVAPEENREFQHRHHPDRVRGPRTWATPSPSWAWWPETSGGRSPPPTTPRLRGSGRTRASGRSSIFFDALGTVEFTSTHRTAMVADGDLVITWLHVAFTSPKGRDVDMEEVQIWQLADGKVQSVSTS